MAGKSLTIDDLRGKLTTFCQANKEYVLEEANGKFLVTKEGQPPISIGIKNGKADSSDIDFLQEVVDFQAGLAPVPAIVGEDATKIMGLLAQVPGYTPEITVGMVANLVGCPEATSDDLIVLAVRAKAIGANPFLPGEIFLIKPKMRDDGSRPPAYTVIGQTLVAKKLANAPGFSRSTRGIIVESKEGAISYREGKYYNPKREELVGGWADIYYDNRPEKVRSEIALSEVIGNSPNWKKSPATMVAKCAFMDCARTAEPNLMGGCYDADEMSGRIRMDESKAIDMVGQA
jgi:hypothetical protein